MVGLIDYDAECVCSVHCQCLSSSRGVGSIYRDAAFEYCKLFLDFFSYLYQQIN